MNVEQIKAHTFFDGVDWMSIRDIDAPFVPHLKSITDTAYFPTDDLEGVPDQPAGADTSGAKDLAFLGFVKIDLLSGVDSFPPQIHFQAFPSFVGSLMGALYHVVAIHAVA